MCLFRLGLILLIEKRLNFVMTLLVFLLLMQKRLNF